MMKKILIVVFLFSLSAFCEKTRYLPPYQPESLVDDEVLKFLNEEDSVRTKNINRIVRSKTNRDILGRLTEDSTIYVLREELIEKRIPVGVIDLTLRNKQDENVIDFYRNQNGKKIVHLNGKEISLEEYREIARKTSEQFQKPFIHYDNLTASEIKALIAKPKPVRVFSNKKLSIQKTDVNYYHYSIIFGYTGVNDMHLVGAKGRDIGIFFADNEGCPDVSVLNEEFFIQSGNCSIPTQHATMVAKLMQLTAPEATIVNFIDRNAVITSVDQNANQFNPTLEIGSYSWQYASEPCIDGSYCYHDQELDQHIYEKRLIYFISAGNKEHSEDVYVSSPGIALNAIAVGAVDPHTGMYVDYSKWKNSELLNQKPEIANYTNFYLGNSFLFGGTSASSPYSAAIAAIMLSADSDLKRHPEVIKSMFLVNATNPINNANFHDLDDLYYVASKLPYFDVNRGIAYGWWSGPNACCFDSDEKIVFTESEMSTGLHCRAAISWLTSGLYAGVYKTLAQDIDLIVYQGANIPIACSENAYNPYEIVDFITQSNENLRIEIKRYANSYSDNVALGFAMRCDYE